MIELKDATRPFSDKGDFLTDNGNYLRNKLNVYREDEIGGLYDEYIPT